MIPADWNPHRRDDGELVGWIRPAGDAWLAVDVLGREISGPIEWLDAEAALEERGIAWLADPWMLDGEGPAPLRVRVVEVTPARVGGKGDDYGDVRRHSESFELPWPAPARLREPQHGDPDGFTFTG